MNFFVLSLSNGLNVLYDSVICTVMVHNRNHSVI